MPKTGFFPLRARDNIKNKLNAVALCPDGKLLYMCISTPGTVCISVPSKNFTGLVQSEKTVCLSSWIINPVSKKLAVAIIANLYCTKTTGGDETDPLLKEL